MNFLEKNEANTPFSANMWLTPPPLAYSGFATAKIRRGVQYGSRYLILGLAKLGGGDRGVQLYSVLLSIVPLVW